jgi:leucyl/phenylalanyl-tRNA--protein transferase
MPAGGSSADVERPSWVDPPRPVGPCRWELDPRRADADGVAGAGADLDVSTLVAAYHRGLFPWPHRGVPLLWFSPDPRAVLVPQRFRVSRSLRRRLRGSGWTTTVDRDVEGVIQACSVREEGTWITPEIRDAYLELAALGWVHSVEVWAGDRLVGGIYGVRVGGVFTGESMFHRRSGASKVALVDLCARLDEAGATLLDVQLPTDHLRSMGAQPIPRERFLERLVQLRDQVCLPVCAELPVARLG